MSVSFDGQASVATRAAPGDSVCDTILVHECSGTPLAPEGLAVNARPTTETDQHFAPHFWIFCVVEVERWW